MRFHRVWFLCTWDGNSDLKWTRPRNSMSNENVWLTPASMILWTKTTDSIRNMHLDVGANGNEMAKCVPISFFFGYKRWRIAPVIWHSFRIMAMKCDIRVKVAMKPELHRLHWNLNFNRIELFTITFSPNNYILHYSFGDQSHRMFSRVAKMAWMSWKMRMNRCFKKKYTIHTIHRGWTIRIRIRRKFNQTFPIKWFWHWLSIIKDQLIPEMLRAISSHWNWQWLSQVKETSEISKM